MNEVLLFLPILFFFAWALFMVLSIIKGAPYVKTPKKRISEIIKLLELKESDVAMDLGSGNGEIIIAMARRGVETHGVEINWFLVFFTWLKIRVAGLSGKAFVKWGNMWKQDLSKFNVIVVYGFPTIMKDLEAKLDAELPVGARVISHAFQFPNWKPIKQSESVFLYIKK
jgi:hypothetical protein